jgi:hypothetical protein
MQHENGNTVSHDEQAVAIQVARWLIVALPEDLANALDTYAASLESETTASAAARKILQIVLLGRTGPWMLAVSPTVDEPPTHPVPPGQT